MHICFRPSFDDVTRINFRFRLLVTWSSPRRRDASSHIIWCKISLFSPKLLTIFRNSRWRPPPSWIFSLCEFGHSGVLIVWLVLVLCAKFGSTICYSHSDRRTYASDLHLITSRELTSGFDFWSRGHLCMAVMHLPIKFGAYIFIQSGVIDWYFSKSKDGGRRHLGFVWMSHGTTHEASFVVRTSYKNFVMIPDLVFKL